jgi:hypothetical protein
MKQTVLRNDFVHAFKSSHTYNKFTVEALDALYNYFEEIEDDTAMSIDFDMVAICCEYAEYGTSLECAEYYGFNSVAGIDPEDFEHTPETEAREWLENRTQVIDVQDTGRIVVASF